MRPDSAQSKFPLEISLRGSCVLYDEAPLPPSQPAPQGFLQSKNALRRTRLPNLLLGRKIVRLFTNQWVLACQKESASKIRRRLPHWKGNANLELPGSQKGRSPFVSEGVQRKPFQGFPLGNFFLTADAVLLCAAKKNGVGTRTSWHVTPEAHWPYLATAGKTQNTAGVTRTKDVPYGRIFAHQSI